MLLACDIDVDIARLDALSRTLKSRRNDCAPLFSLPSEVIEAILEACSWGEPPIKREKRDRMQTGPDIGWIRLGHICSRLRHIVLNIPTLWASILFLFPKAYDMILPRAKALPVTIDLLGLFPAELQLVSSQVRPLFHNARSLTVDLPSFKHLRRENTPFTNSLDASKAFPLLHTLTLVAIKMSSDITALAASEPAIHAPLLRHLTIENSFIRCDFSTLHTLELHFHDPGHGSSGLFGFGLSQPPFNAGDLFASLGHLTNLRRLLVRGGLFQPFSATSDISLSLPSLESLEVNAKHEFIESLLSTISIPPTTRLKIIVNDNRPNTGTFFHTVSSAPDVQTSSLLVALAAKIMDRLQLQGALPVDGVRLDCHQSSLTLFTSKKGAFSAHLTGPLAQDYIPTIDLHMKLGDPLVLLEHVPRDPNSRGPVVLELTATPVLVSSQRWRQILSDYEAVHALVLGTFPPSASLMNALCSASVPEPASLGPVQGPILPGLQVLYFNVGSKDTEQADIPHAAWGSPPFPLPPSSAPEDLANLLGQSQVEEVTGDEPGAGLGGSIGVFSVSVKRIFHAAGWQQAGISGMFAVVGIPSVAPWRGVVDGLRHRAELGFPVQRVVVEDDVLDGTGDGARSLMTMMKEDLRAVVPEVLNRADCV